MTKEFYNPYAFIPLGETSSAENGKGVAYNKTQGINTPNIYDGSANIGHHTWGDNNRLSGAIYLTISQETDLIIGGERTGNSPTNVAFYRQPLPQSASDCPDNSKDKNKETLDFVI